MYTAGLGVYAIQQAVRNDFGIIMTYDAIERRLRDAGAWDPTRANNTNTAGESNHWPGDRGAEEWGRRNGIARDEARRKFHEIKQDDPCSSATDDYRVDPETGNVFDPEGEIIGNLND
jgi:hypothetical protein